MSNIKKKITTIEKYLCPECEKEFDSEKEAEECHTYPKTIEISLHSAKEDNWYKTETLGFKEGTEAFDRFLYALYEVTFKLEVDKDGNYEILEINGVKVSGIPT